MACVVQFIRQVEGIRVSRGMRTPKRITDINAWFKQARKTIKELDALMNENTGWCILTHDTDIRYVLFELRNNHDQKAQVVIDRTANFGA